MKKHLKIILLNIIYVVLLLIIFNSLIESVFLNENVRSINNLRLKITTYFLNRNIDNSKVNIDNSLTEPAEVIKIEANNENLKEFCGNDRKGLFHGENYKKPPIIVFGCSYAYGHGLKNEQSFPYLLSETTKRPVYNFSNCGSDIINSYKEYAHYISLPQNAEQNKNIFNSEYLIYVYMWDHINRYTSINNGNHHMYYNYDELFHPQKLEKIISSFPLGKYILYSIKTSAIFSGYPSTDKTAEILKRIIILVRDKVQKDIPNIKMIVIIYDEKIPDYHDIYLTKFVSDKMKDKIWDELQNKEGITVVHSSDLTGFAFNKEYKLKEDISDWHPNDKAWALFTPLLAKKYIN